MIGTLQKWLILNLKYLFTIWIYFLNEMYYWIFSIFTSVFSVVWALRNHFNILICSSRNISYYLHIWKGFVA